MVVDDCRTVTRGSRDPCYSKTARIETVRVGLNEPSARVSVPYSRRSGSGALLLHGPVLA